MPDKFDYLVDEILNILNEQACNGVSNEDIRSVLNLCLDAFPND